MDKYTQNLVKLSALQDNEYCAIPECARDVIDRLDTGKIATREQAWLFGLCKSISPKKEDSQQFERPWPRYIPIKTLKKGGEAILLTATDQWRKDEIVVLKVPLPKFSFKRDQERRKKQEPDRKLVRGAKAMLELGKGLYRRKKLEKPAKKETKQPQDFRRFRRSFDIQGQLCRITSALGREYGYVPNVYEFGNGPHCYFSQEYVRGDEYLEWIRTHSDEENMKLFLSLVRLVESGLHAYGVVHADIAARNVLIDEGVPVLLDFGIVKVPQYEDITMQDAQLGSILTASHAQMRDSKNRNFQDDIFSLGRLLWVTLARRIPALVDVVVWETPNGRIDYQDEAVAAMFDPFSISKQFRDIFQLTQSGGYPDISDFRKSLESLIFHGRNLPLEFCNSHCARLSKLENVIKILLGDEE